MRRCRGFAFLVALCAFLLLSSTVVADEGVTRTVVGRDFVLPSGEALMGDLFVVAGRTHLEFGSMVDGNVTVMGGETLVDGAVSGNVLALGGSFTLSAGAQIDGDLVAFGRVERHPDAVVWGDVIEGVEASASLGRLSELFSDTPARPFRWTRPSTSATRLGRGVASLLGLLLLTAAVGVLLPSNVGRISTMMMSSPLLCGIVGILTLVLAGMLIPILVILCIGVPVAIVAMVALGLGALFGWATAGALFVRKLTDLLKIPAPRPLAQMLLGTVITALLAMVPCAGPVFATIVLCWALGAVVLTRFGTVSASPWDTRSGRTVSPTESTESRVDHEDEEVKQGRPRDTKPLDASALAVGTDPDGI